MLACMKIIFLNVIDPLKAGWLIYVSPALRQRNSTLFLWYVFFVCGSQDKQRLLRYTAFPNCILYESKSVLTFVGPCVVIYLYSKTNQIYNISNLFYFGITLCVFRTVSPSIIGSLRLYVQHKLYVIQVL
jgi:hypothetical protein